MTHSPELDRLLGPIVALQALIDATGKRGMIIGGVAASLLGRPRLTADVDALFVLPPEALRSLIDTARRHQLFPRVEDPLEFAQDTRMLLFRHEPSGLNVDISLGSLPFEEEAVSKAATYAVGALSLRLVRPEDLIILKAVAHRPRDMADIAAVASNHPDIDAGYIEYWLLQFAGALDAPEIWTDVERILKGQ